MEILQSITRDASCTGIKDAKSCPTSSKQLTVQASLRELCSGHPRSDEVGTCQYFRQAPGYRAADIVGGLCDAVEGHGWLHREDAGVLFTGQAYTYNQGLRNTSLQSLHHEPAVCFGGFTSGCFCRQLVLATRDASTSSVGRIS